MSNKQKFPLFAIGKHEKGSAKNMARHPLANQWEIASWWDGTLEPHKKEAVLNAIAQLRQREQWIACTCTGNNEDPPLAGAFMRNGVYGLRRLTDRAMHASGCVFEFDQKEDSADQADQSGPVNESPQTQPRFLEETKVTALTNSRENEGNDRQGSSAKRLDPLARQLFWLLSSCGMDAAPAPGLAMSPVKRLLDAARATPLAQDLDLGHLLYCKAEAWTNAWMDKSFQRCASLGIEPQAILLCPVYGVSRKESWVQLEPDGPKVPVDGRLAVYGDDESPARYPMLMYAKIVQRKGGQTVISKAYAHPVASESHWLLVDSNYERQALSTLLAVREILLQKSKYCVIQKPLINWNGTGARPDFVVVAEVNGAERTLIVETMGSTDPVYAARKRDTLAKLIGTAYFEDKRYIQDGTADALLKGYVLGFFDGSKK